MTAHSQGQRLLGHVAPSKSLDEILSRLISIEAEQYHASVRVFDFAPVDACIAEAQSNRSYITNPSDHPIVELSSSQHGAGKTQLLYTIITMATLPEKYHDVHLQGSNGAVIVLDADHRFKVARLADSMKCYVRACWGNAITSSEARENDENSAAEGDQMQVEAESAKKSATDVPRELDESMLDHLVTKALDHVLIFRPNSLESLISTISQMPAYLFDPSEHKSYDRQLKAIILDSADAFYWNYRAEQDSRRGPKLPQARDQAAASTNLKAAVESQENAATYRQLVHELRLVSKALSAPIIATVTNPIASTNMTNERSEFTDQKSTSMLPAPWHSLPTLRLQVGKEPVTRFAPYISADQALRERADRQKVVDQARFTARVVDGNGGFDFRITAEGVKVDDT